METTNNFKLNSFIITIDGKEIALSINQVIYMRYIEDIESATKMMEVQITDSNSGLLSLMRGMERVYIEIEDNVGNQIGGIFTVYDIQDRVSEGTISKATILLCTSDFINNAAIKVSRKFGDGQGKRIDEIVTEDILKGILRTETELSADNIEPTFNKYSFVSPFWCPFTVISWLASKSIPIEGSGASASAGYAFFENKFGYNFKSYDSFTKDPVVKTLILGHEPKDTEEVDGENILAIDRMRVLSSSDVLKGLNIGSYNSNVMTVDLSNMKYEETKFNINKYYDTVPRLNKSPKPQYFENFKKDTAATRIMSKIVDTALFSKGTHTAGLTKQLSQASLREKLFYNKIVEVSYFGKFDLTVGDVVQLDIYQGRSRGFDKANSGKYVISKVDRTYYSNRDMMGTQLTLVTDSPGA
ncbi:MAG: hypothetical protein CMF94_00020 [Candidatus Marinimicrobia bacterium]|nr:hypothetical protein [Candidatus Neomarinimicrobiota bacterium]